MGSDMDHSKAMQPAAVLPLIKPWFMQQFDEEIRNSSRLSYLKT
jgi:hypothetical protein